MIGFDTLYSWVKDLPVVDWHNHLDMKMLAEDKPLGSLYEVWVKADPYKHRAMRICGEPERVITGDASEGEVGCMDEDTSEARRQSAFRVGEDGNGVASWNGWWF